MHATLDDWIQREAIPFSTDSTEAFAAALDQIISALGNSVELLGFGEALHGGEEILRLRNRIFQRLVVAHGYSAMAIESSFPKALVVNEYIAGRGPASYEEVNERGFSPGFSGLEANRDLVEWVRSYNADPAHPVKLRFYGFDIPAGPTGYPSPRQVLQFALDYLSAVNPAIGQEHRERIEPLIGSDADWENPAVYADSTKGFGLSPSATALRIATEDLLTEFRNNRPEWVADSGKEQYLEALQHVVSARELLNSHAALARNHAGRFNVGLGIRDALMAENLAYVVERERGRGKVLAFAHNSHLQRGKAALPSLSYAWWPAGAQLHEMMGERYAVIGSALGVSEPNGIGQPEAGALEARLTIWPDSNVFIPTHQGEGLPTEEIAALPSRSGSAKNLSYVPLDTQSLTNFDCLAVLVSTSYTRGARPLPG